MVLAALAGISVSTAHVMPEAIFPDVIDWDELRTRTMREGMYYGAINISAQTEHGRRQLCGAAIMGGSGTNPPRRASSISNNCRLPSAPSASLPGRWLWCCCCLPSALLGISAFARRQLASNGRWQGVRDVNVAKNDGKNAACFEKCCAPSGKANRQARRMERKMRSSLIKIACNNRQG